MSIFSGIASAEHTFVAWAENELATLEKKAPTIEKVIGTGISYITPALNIALDSLGGATLVPEVDSVITEVQKDLLVGSSLVYDFGPTPTASTIFTSIKDNLAGLLSAGHIKGTVATKAVNKAINEAGAISAAISTAAQKISDASKQSSTNSTDSTNKQGATEPAT